MHSRENHILHIFMLDVESPQRPVVYRSESNRASPVGTLKRRLIHVCIEFGFFVGTKEK